MTGIFLMTLVSAALGWAIFDIATDRDAADTAEADDPEADGDHQVEMTGLDTLLAAAGLENTSADMSDLDEMSGDDSFAVQIAGLDGGLSLSEDVDQMTAIRVADFDAANDMITVELTDGPDSPGRNFTGIDLVHNDDGTARLDLSYPATETAPESTASILLLDAPGITLDNIQVVTQPVVG